MDELFLCGHFCAVYMNQCNFHTGLLVVKPDQKTFHRLLKGIANHQSYDGGDQGFLTAFYGYEEMQNAQMFNPLNGKSEAEVNRLPSGYNMNVFYHQERGNYDRF